MPPWLSFTIPTLDPLARLVVDSALKGAIIFAVAGLISLALRRRSAAARHLLWSLGGVAALALPLLTAVLPGWDVPWPFPKRHAGIAVHAPTRLPHEGPLALASTSRPAVRVPAETTTRTMSVPEPAVARRPALRAAPSGHGWSIAPRWAWLPWAWSVGAIASFLPAAAGLWSLERLARTSRRVTRGPVPRLCEELAKELGLKRRVVLLRSRHRAIPMTWGVWRPVVLLPKDAVSWSEERLTMVLMHELAHVKRNDFMTQLISRLVVACHWFNPLAWFALARIRVEQERACDDLALSRGLEATEYAGHLLAIISRSGPLAKARLVAPAMASSSVEDRLRSILDPARDRRPLAKRQAFAAVIAAVCILAPLATGRFGSASAAPPEDAKAKDAPPGQGANSQVGPREQADVLEQLRKLYVKPPDESVLIDGAIRGMLEALHDPHTIYLGAADLKLLEAEMRASLTGIGAQLRLVDGRPTIDDTLPDSPARKARLRSGDALLEVDGKPTNDVSLAEIVKRIIGPAGSVVRLKVTHRGGGEELVEIKRAVIKIRTVEGARHTDDGKPDGIIDPDNKVAYLRVVYFASATPDELKEAIEAFQRKGMKGMVLDLRGSPGGHLEPAVAVANMFLPEGTIVSIRGRDGAESVMKADPKKALGDFPLVVLIDETTASAAEIVAGALKDHNRAVLVGSRTFGKGSVQSIVKLKDGAGALKLTTAYYTLPSGRNIDHSEGKTTWGVDPNDGDFVPMGKRPFAEILERRRALGEGAALAVDPDDRQLAAALKAIVARLTTGEFAKVGESPSALATYVRRASIQKKRDALLKDLERVDKELEALKKSGATN